MQSVESIPESKPLLDRLSTRLALLFAASFLGAMIVMGAWALLGMIAERQRAAQLSTPPPTIVIDPKIHEELSKALAFDAIPASAQVQNPFVDRAGLSGSVATTTSSPARPNATSSATGSSPSKPGATSGSSTTVASGGHSGGGAEVIYVAPPSDATKSRYEDWLARQKRGEFVVPESEVLGVEDLVPVGYATGGNRGAEVILLSLSLCRTFTFPAGTRFYDGMLNGFDQREVVFVFGNGVRRKSYLTEDACKPAQAPGALATN